MAETKKNTRKRPTSVRRKPPTRNHQLARFKRILRKHLPELRERYKVESLAVFGSVVRGEAGEGSDVDLLVEFTRPVGLFKFVDLMSHLESLLGRKVDLGTPASLNPKLRERVLQEAIYVT